MSKLTVASKLADELGTTISKASRFVDDVGLGRARTLADDAAAKGGQVVSDWWKPAAAGGAIIGGGTLAWRQQDIQQAKAIADQQQEYGSAVQSIVESDLPPEMKRQMVDQITSRSPSNNDGGNDQGDEGPVAQLKNALGLDGDGLGLQGTVIMLVVLALVLRYTIGGSP